MKNKKENILYFEKSIIFIVILICICAVEIVYAETTAQIKFCDYGSVRKTLKILGIFLTLAKIAIPAIWTFTGMATFFKALTGGKPEDLKTAATAFGKKLIAGFIVFIIPTAIDYAFDNLIGYSDKGFTQCTNCLLDTGNCNVNVADPSTYK